MKALTVQPPWSQAIAVGAKLVENRSRAMRYRGPLAIHAGARWSTRGGASDAVIAALAGPGGLGPISEQAGREILGVTSGAVVAVVDVVDCHRDAGCCRPWGEPDLWHIVLENARPLPEPVPARGRLGLWDTDIEDPTVLRDRPTPVAAAGRVGHGPAVRRARRPRTPGVPGMTSVTEVCWCTHPASDHDAGECWAEVDTPAGQGQCACNWWEPVAAPQAAEEAGSA